METDVLPLKLWTHRNVGGETDVLPTGRRVYLRQLAENHTPNFNIVYNNFSLVNLVRKDKVFVLFFFSKYLKFIIGAISALKAVIF